MTNDKKQLITNKNDNFDADLAPVYNRKEKKRRFDKQGKVSFYDEFFSLYRKWIKRE